MANDQVPTLYRALKGLAYPTDPTVVKRLLKGEDVPWEARGIREVEPGAEVNDIPSVSIPWLLEQGMIEVVVADG